MPESERISTMPSRGGQSNIGWVVSFPHAQRGGDERSGAIITSISTECDKAGRV